MPRMRNLADRNLARVDIQPIDGIVGQALGPLEISIKAPGDTIAYEGAFARSFLFSDDCQPENGQVNLALAVARTDARLGDLFVRATDPRLLGEVSEAWTPFRWDQIHTASDPGI